MPVHSTVSRFPAWFLALWQRIISAPRVLTQRSISVLYFLFAILKGRGRGGGGLTRDDGLKKTIFSSGRTITVDLPYLGGSQGSLTICASTVPTEMSNLGASLHPSGRQGQISQPELTVSPRPNEAFLHPHFLPQEPRFASRSSPNVHTAHTSQRPQRSRSPHSVSFLRPPRTESHEEISFTTVNASSSSIDSEIPQIENQSPSTENGNESRHSVFASGQNSSNISRSSQLYGLGSIHNHQSPYHLGASSRGSVISLTPSHTSRTTATVHSRPVSSVHSVWHVERSHDPLLRAPSPNHGAISSRPGSPLPVPTEHELALPVHAVAPPPSDCASQTCPTAVEERVLFAMSPEWTERYSRPADVKQHPAKFTVGPMTRTFPRANVPKGWVTYTHPEGVLYFYNMERSIITDAYLCNPDVLDDIELFLRQIEEKRSQEGIEIPRGSQLVMELMPSDSDDDIICGYYFVDHENRSLFWLDDFEADYLLRDIRGHVSATLMQHEIESQYWKHREFFPNLYDLTKSTVEEFRGVMIHSIGDALTSPVSTSPYNTETLTSMLNLVNEAKAFPDVRNSHIETCLCRMMATLAHQRLINNHGEKCPRLSSDQSIQVQEIRKRSYLLRFLSPILFSAPDVHKRSLEKIYVDHVVREVVWRIFIDKLNEQWQEFLLLGEVLLTVNVSFLAIPSVDTTNPGQNANPQRSLAQIASYISIVATVGSIFMGLLLVRQNRTKSRESVAGAAGFLNKMTQTSLGLDTLAILYSLPYALLMWGMIAFVVAFSCLCFQATELPAQLSVGTSGAAVFALVIWCIYTAWENHGHFWDKWWPKSAEPTEEEDIPSEKDSSPSPWWRTVILRRRCHAEDTSLPP